MGLSSFWCYAWWFALGALLGWLAWWLLDRLVLRDRDTPLRLAEAEKELADKHSEIALQTEELLELRGKSRRLDMQSNQIAELRKEVDARKDLEQLFETEYGKVNAELERTAKLLAERTAEVTQLRTESQGAGAQVASLSEEIETLRNTLRDGANGEAEIARLKEELARSNAQIEDATVKLAALSELQADNERLAKRLNGASSLDEVTQLKADYDARGALIARSEAEISELKQLLVSSKQALESQKSEITRLAAGLAAASGPERDELRSELSAARELEQRLRIEIAALGGQQERAAQLNDELTAARGVIRELRTELGDSAGNERRAARLEADLEAARGVEQALREELASARARIASLDRLRLTLEAARQAAAGHASEVARLNDEIFASMRDADGAKGGKS